MAAAKAALQDKEHINKSFLINKQGLKQLEQGFKKLNLRNIPSVGNFITVDMKKDATIIYKDLLEKGIIVRPLVPYNMPNHLRISVGTYEQNMRLLNTLESILTI